MDYMTVTLDIALTCTFLDRFFVFCFFVVVVVVIVDVVIVAVVIVVDVVVVVVITEFGREKIIFCSRCWLVKNRILS